MVDYKPIFLFGAGDLAHLIMSKLGVIDGFVVDNLYLRESDSEIPIIGLDEFKTNYTHNSCILYVCICKPTISVFSLVKNLQNYLGCNVQVEPFTHIIYYENILRHYLYWSNTNSNSEEISILTSLLRKIRDHQGKKHLQYFLYSKSNGLTKKCVFTDYSKKLDFLSSNSVKHYIDCGAFNGDTMFFCGSINQKSLARKVTLIEPDPINLLALKSKICASRFNNIEFNILNVALNTHRNGSLFNCKGNMSSRCSNNGNKWVKTIRLEDIVTESNILLKFDIEGLEPEVIRDGLDAIRKYKPTMAISVYHNSSDLFRIYYDLVNLSVGYKFSFRVFGKNGTDAMLFAY